MALDSNHVLHARTKHMIDLFFVGENLVQMFISQPKYGGSILPNLFYTFFVY